MKTTILTIAFLLATVFGISQTACAAASATTVSTLLTNISGISKIEVHGNVTLYLSSGNAEQVKVYDNYYAGSALVQNENGVLRITSYNPEKLVVWVTVTDLQNLAVYDNATVQSFGKFSAIDLEVKLYNHASAALDMDAFAASFTLNDHAKADLTGAADKAEIHYTESSFLNTGGFTAAKLVETVKFYPRDCDRKTEWASI